MPVVSADIVQYGTEPTPVPEIYPDPRYALKITLAPGQTAWIVSHDDALPLLPAGAVHIGSARLLDTTMPNINRNAGFESGSATISVPTYEVVDVDDDFSEYIADKNINGFSLNNSLISEYEFQAGDAGFSSKEPKFTGQIGDHDKPYNTVQLKCQDINRGLQNEIFDPISWRLNSSITATQTTIPTTLPVDLIPDYTVTFQHSHQYIAHPNETGGYAKIGDEVFWYAVYVAVDGIATFLGVQRAQLGTKAAAVEVTAGVADSNKPEIKEWIVIDETPIDFVRGIVNGTLTDGRQFPDHWHAKADIYWVDLVRLAVHSTAFRLKFEGLTKTRAKQFLEKEVLSPMQAVLAVDGFGRLNWTPKVYPVDANAGEIVLNESNCDTTTIPVLSHITSKVHPRVKIEYDYNPHSRQFLSPITYVDLDARDKFKVDRTKTFSYKGVHSGIHTGTQITKLASTFGDNYFEETLGLTLTSYITNIRLGQLVTVNLQEVYDDTTLNADPLERTFMVVSAEDNRRNRTTTYQLRGSLFVQSERNAGVLQHNLSAEEYKRGKINLDDLAGVTIDNGIMTGTLVLVPGFDYYYVNDANPGEGLELAESLNVVINGRGRHIGLHVFGPLVIKCEIDLTATSNNLGGNGSSGTDLPRPGEQGYALSSRATGRMITESRYVTFLSSNQTGYREEGFRVTADHVGTFTEGQFSRAPDPVLNVNDGLLGGLPGDLSGTGGPGGAATIHKDADLRPRDSIADGAASNPTTTYVDGSSGGRGGGGLLIVSWGGAVVGNGKIIMNGGDPDPANTLLVNRQSASTRETLVGARGGPGGPGSLLWVVDGNHPRPLLTSDHVIAMHGDATPTGNPVEVQKHYKDGGTYRSSHLGTPQGNQWESVTRITYTPAAEAVQSLFNLEDQIPDGNIRVFVQDERPSDGNPHDLWITHSQLHNGGISPATWVFLGGGYTPVQWEDNLFADAYRAALAMARDGGSQFFFGPERPTEFTDDDVWLNTNTGVEWTLYNPPKTDQVRRYNNIYVGEELIDDVNFHLSAMGQEKWILTRNANIQPINTAQAIADDIANIFINHGLIEGEYETPGSDSGGGSSGGGGGGATQVGPLLIFVDGNQVDIQGLDYYQIQRTSDNSNVWEGQGPDQLTLANGTYDFINLTTGLREDNIVVSGSTTGGSATPDPPPGITLTAISSTDVEVRWSLPADTSVVSTYGIYIDGANHGYSVNQPYLITGLTAETTYQIGVSSVGLDNSESSQTSQSVTTPAAGGGGGQQGIVLADSGRTVTGTAWQNNGAAVIEVGRQISLNLNNGSQFLTNVGANGAFTFNIPTSADANLNLPATLYTNNPGDPNVTFAQLSFTYEL